MNGRVGTEADHQAFLKRCGGQLAELGYVTLWTPADRQRRTPTFAYTVGLEVRFSAPEWLLFACSHDDSLIVINTLVRRFLRRKCRLPLDEPIGEVLGDVPLIVKAVPTERAFAYAPRAIEHCLLQGRRCEFQQLVRPDPAGRFPGERGYDKRWDRCQPQLFSP